MKLFATLLAAFAVQTVIAIPLEADTDVKGFGDARGPAGAVPHPPAGPGGISHAGKSAGVVHVGNGASHGSAPGGHGSHGGKGKARSVVARQGGKKKKKGKGLPPPSSPEDPTTP